MFVTEPFLAYLAKTIEATDVYLPLASAPYADLLKLLNNGDYTYLTIQDGTNLETVKAYASGGTILLDRGQCTTEAKKFSYGSQVCTVSPTLICAMEAIARETATTCYNPDAMGTNLSFMQRDLPAGSVGVNYRGHVILGGKLPITVSVSGAPSWATVTHYANMIEITGLPSIAGSNTITITAKNSFDESISHSYTLTVN